MHQQTGCKVGYDADYGRLGAFDSLHHPQQIFAVTDLNVSLKWEIHLGVVALRDRLTRLQSDRVMLEAW